MSLCQLPVSACGGGQPVSLKKIPRIGKMIRDDIRLSKIKVSQIEDDRLIAYLGNANKLKEILTM